MLALLKAFVSNLDIFNKNEDNFNYSYIILFSQSAVPQIVTTIIHYALLNTRVRR